MTAPLPMPRPSSRKLGVIFVLLAPLLLGACAGNTGRSMGPSTGAMRVPAYPDRDGFVWCVPYARYVSGVALSGDAGHWWDQARGRYDRGQTPRLGSVLALRATERLRSGHVAVVTAIESRRAIRVAHANWGWNDKTRGRVYEDMPVVDVSRDNDWTEVRFLHPDIGDYGRSYPAHGFIYPATMAQATPAADQTLASR
ncbi:hypothetical protein F11_11115 [Rhodospirillum rubrum F11]|uniref:CHAP n=2 Tax=Rhodospirillum rubrum TaxID=1085 RepID=Q2RSD8_RHORT|nr:CHAP domain-containing protein [Rhodospirillum rubrum]ABC22957.1 CHAP [Rhodospirillum rubrum ATCC 11170]AEO48687.1 hypothetical protein F11_11115 [Rhodospirillum rubrum F11]MBK5954582.1 CHAP domain-containing protein [Rhodospirillum rubrum]QXG78943.1 CHAP domain-containing protein [Rhodospirillum rubrum]HAQ01408.1 CHAP domain-containing protein [Rhodospirillum rubrum]